MDKFRIDGQKLIYHISRVHQWLEGGNIYPIYVEIGLFGGCNHRCIFCAFDFFKYKPEILDESCLRKFVLESAEKGIKAVLYSGEGEPLLHKDATDIIVFTKKAGIDVALSTNGVMLGKEVAKKSLGYLTWLRVSLDAGTKENYSIIHGTKKEDFNIAIANLKEAVKIRNKNKYTCTIGTQILLIPQNYKGVITLAKILSDIGVDHLIIKPYSQHPSSINRIDAEFKYADFFHWEEKLRKYSKGNFQIIMRRHTMEKLGREKPYEHCLGLPFATYIAAQGDVYPCSLFLGRKDFIFGNIYNESFRDIWEGKRRRKIMDRIFNKWDINKCRENCRLDELNRYLWELTNPSKHVNFI